MSKSIAISLVCSFAAFIATSEAAAAPPKELYGKSITVQWSEARSERYEIDKVARETGAAVQTSIYISTAGRPFVRVHQTGISGSPGGVHGSTSEVAPGGSSAAKDRVAFEGRSIVLYRQFESGARRIAIDFDGADKSCKATVIVGREGGKNIVRYTAGRGRAEVFSIRVGSVSCSIQDGNVFGQ